MIDYKVVQISTLDDYDLVLKELVHILPNANHKFLINELKSRIALQCHSIIIEYPYRDFEFSSVYSLFYSKKHQKISKECVRLHFFDSSEFEQKSYIGNFVVRDSKIDSRGKGIFKPKVIASSTNGYIVTAKYKSHIMGESFEIETYPWMAQDTDIAVCAHVAVWSVNNYFANKYPNYQLKSVGAISEIVPEYMGRKTPSDGLNLLQVSEMFSKLGFYPLVLSKNNSNDTDFFQAVYSYIESGIPMVGAMTKKAHAVALIGHGKIDTEALSLSSQSYINIADYLTEIVIADDNDMPFTMIAKQDGKYSFEDLDYVIIPLYEKMYINANIVNARAKAIVESKVLSLDDKVVARIYLTSARSFKKETLKNRSMNSYLKSILLRLHTPQFIWCVDLSSIDGYIDSKISARIVLDATAGTYEDEPWLLMHDGDTIYWKDNDQIYTKKEPIVQYEIYKNNLKEM